jgi:hypothetical protein
MGQRNAIAMFLWSGGILVPVIVFWLVASELGRAAMPVALLLLCMALVSFIVAKWPLLSRGQLFSFGPSPLSSVGRRFYWAGVALAISGVGLCLGALPMR